MSDPIQHECGIAMVRLLKPLDYYREKYGSPLYGFDKLFLLMEKQHNRGQDGAGIASLKFDMPAGSPYMFRKRNVKVNALDRIFRDALKRYDRMVSKGTINPQSTQSVKTHFEFGAEIYLGHLRYGTFGGYGTSACHPFFRRNNWPTKNLILAGNFNLTNTDELNQMLIGIGQHPIFSSDTQTLLEQIGFDLDEDHDRIFNELRDKGLSGEEIAQIIGEQLNPLEILRRASSKWDGGYAIAGMIGNGDIFAFRDPGGIRPIHYFRNDEVIAFASERVALMTGFDLDAGQVNEVKPGHAVIVKRDGSFDQEVFKTPVRRTSCTFERIYFSRGNDPEIYRERKALGAALCDQILEAIDHDLDHTVFSFVPNTAEIAYLGMLERLRFIRRQQVKEQILEAAKREEVTEELLDELILNNWPVGEKIAIKDIKLRTFISQEKGRKELVSHIYDISYGTVRAGVDSLVCLDDSIVRGTTLRRSILKMLSRLKPKKIIVVSTAPQIRYPDCYGIDMSELNGFIAFEAAVALVKERGMEELLTEVYEECKRQFPLPATEQTNVVSRIYDSFSPEEISAKIAELITPPLPDWDGEVQLIYQGIQNLHKSLPNHSGDWYFTGKYPTPGGYRILNKAYINYFEKRTGRSY
ncbi:MAG TPA: amidophosphoribosyltransferase [Opitutales bacterium]|nr:amidophosphoribosyltransferase [Opitutales bacterium]